MMTTMTKEIHVVSDRVEVLGTRQDILSKTHEELDARKHFNTDVKSRNSEVLRDLDAYLGSSTDATRGTILGSHSRTGGGLPLGPFPHVGRTAISCSGDHTNETCLRTERLDYHWPLPPPCRAHTIRNDYLKMTSHPGVIAKGTSVDDQIDRVGEERNVTIAAN